MQRIETDAVNPVSYTHLDVYKRQELGQLALEHARHDAADRMRVIEHHLGMLAAQPFDLGRERGVIGIEPGLATARNLRVVGPMPVAIEGLAVERLYRCLLYTSRCV